MTRNREREAEQIVGQFGARLEKLRRTRGLTRREVSQRTGISRPYLWQVEDGRTRPSLDYAIRLARSLNVTVDYFGEDQKKAEKILKKSTLGPKCLGRILRRRSE